MFTITKRSDLEEEYHANKIVDSMGNRVIGGIKNREPQAAKWYESHPKKIIISEKHLP